MKTIISSLLILLALNGIAYATDYLEVNSSINEVTIFLQGAQVSRQASVSLQKGTTTLSFRELPLNIDPQSIQAKGEGKFVILSLLHQVNYLTGQRKTRQVNMLHDSLRVCEEQLALVNSMQAVLQNEEELLKANRQIGSSEKGLVLAELKQIADFYRIRLTEIKKEEIKLTNEARQLHEQIEKIKNQLNTLNASLNKPASEILIQVSCTEDVNGIVIITYTVQDAGWTPIYDIRAKDVVSPVRLSYNARVSQNTGEDWDKVAIKLSTANPRQRGEKPDLQPWYIDFEQPVGISREYNLMQPTIMKRAMAMPAEGGVDEGIKEVQDDFASSVASYTEISESQTNLEFIITLPYDIPSDNKQYTINIQEYVLPATYAYYCAPKLDRDAFLIARITGWENYNLLAGEMNLFFEGTYVGKSYLKVRNTKDTLDLSLGRDKGIVVTRVKIKDYTEEKTIGSNKRETRAWEITIRNTKKQTIDLYIEDQFPVSMNKDIEIEPIEYAGGLYNKDTGLITWKQQIEPSFKKKLRISYAVRYPKDKHLYLD